MRAPYLSPEHVRYPHLVIVDHTSQMIRWEPVRFEQHHIVWERLCRELHVAVYQVGRYCCTPCPALPRSDVYTVHRMYVAAPAGAAIPV